MSIFLSHADHASKVKQLIKSLEKLQGFSNFLALTICIKFLIYYNGEIM